MNKIPIIFILALVGLLGYWAGLKNSSGSSLSDSFELDNVKSSKSDSTHNILSESKPAFEPNRGEFSTTRTDGETLPVPTGNQTRKDLLRQVGSNDPLEQMSAFVQLCQNLDDETIKVMIEAYEKKDWDGIDAMLFLNYFTYAWARHDPIAALEWSKTRDPFIEQDLVCEAMLSGWASVDPQASLKWARENESLKDEEQKRGNELLIGVMKGMAETDLAGATELMKELNYGLYLDKAASTLLASAWAKGEQTAIDWVESFPDGKARNSAYEALGKRLIREDIDRAVEWVDSMDESEIKTKIAKETAKAMVILSPDKAADWVARMPAGEARSAGMERVVSQWVERDPVATAEWLNKFPNDQSIDGALAIFSHQIADKQSQSALQWAQSIEDSERRERVIQYIKNKK
jgi:hypothetical protein